MKYNIPFGVAGEISKYLFYNDIEEALKAKLFDLDVDVLPYIAKPKSKLLAEMAINSSFNYYHKNKNLTVRQTKLLIVEHLKILRKHYEKYEYLSYFIEHEIDPEMKWLNNNLELYDLDYYSPNSSTPWVLSMHANEWCFIDMVRKGLIHCQCSIGCNVEGCPCESILLDFQKTQLFTDIRDLKSFISPKKLKLLKLN
jgi:hypothetical protein